MSCRHDFNDIEGDFGRRKRRDDVLGDFGRRRRCDCVFECLFELLEDAFDNDDRCCHRRDFISPGRGFDSRRRCDCECVFECLFDLLDDALEDDFGRCPR
jgi:hypothetical protein